jgi:hypothetical protein
MPSGVQTPQIEQPVYQPAQMAVPPQPQGQPSQVLPAQAGYVSKAGAGAFVANNILQGYLKGREVKQQRELAKAQNQLQGADYAYQTLAQNYNDMLRSGKQENDPEVQKAKQAASSAWQAKLQIMGQYATPADDKSHKKGAKQKVEGAFANIFGKSGVTPQMIPQAALQVLQNSPPPGLGLTPQDQEAMAQTKTAQAQAELAQASIPVAKAQAETAQMQLQDQKQQQRYDDILLKPSTAWTPEDKQFADQFKKREELKKPEDQQYADAVFQSINTGKPLDPVQRQFAYAHGILTAPQVIQYDDGLKHFVARMDPDGNIISKQQVGRVYHEDEVSNAVRMTEAMHKIRVRDMMQGGMDEATANRAALLEESKNPVLVDAMLRNAGSTMQQLAMNDKILRSLQAEAGKTGGTPQEKQKRLAEWSNFYVPSAENDDTGYFALRDPKPLKDGKYAGGLDATALKKEQDAFYRRYRAKAQELYPKLTSDEIDALVKQKVGGGDAGTIKDQPPAGPGFWSKVGDFLTRSDNNYPGRVQNAYPTLKPPPGANASTAVLGEQGPGMKLYTVQTDQGPQKVWLNDVGVQQIQQGGGDVQPAQ